MQDQQRCIGRQHFLQPGIVNLNTLESFICSGLPGAAKQAAENYILY